MPNASDPYDLQRFVDAQDPVFGRVRGELKSGRKTSHWMWFVFPQVAGLGHSPMARRYAISFLDEASAYLEHPILAARLRECTRLMLQVGGRTAYEILGSPDDMKFKSCMTLFRHAKADDQIFAEALGKYFAGEEDRLTLERLQRV